MNNLSKVITYTKDTEKKFDLLVDSIQNCRLCLSMELRTKVFSECNGNINSNVLFIAEAPGRLGADRTAIPLLGDQTGVNFQRLIDTIEWNREDFFVTNAVLCNPRDEAGNNATPDKKHIDNCSVYLDTLIKIMEPDYVITLGQKALDSIQNINPVQVKLRDHVRTIVPWNGRKLIPLYHTGPRALVHRNFYNQLADFYWIKQQIKIKAEPWKRLKDSQLSTLLGLQKFKPSKIEKVAIQILSTMGAISEFKLTKLLYLADYKFLTTNGKLLTNSFYLRAYNGPLPMGLDRQLTKLVSYGVLKRRSNFLELISIPKIELTQNEKDFIQSIVQEYGKKTDKEIKTITYLTKPMRRLLRKEKHGDNMLWQPVFGEEDFVTDKS